MFSQKGGFSCFLKTSTVSSSRIFLVPVFIPSFSVSVSQPQVSNLHEYFGKIMWCISIKQILKCILIDELFFFCNLSSWHLAMLGLRGLSPRLNSQLSSHCET
eukprot:sb/3478234/